MDVEEGMTQYFFYLAEPRSKSAEGTTKYNTQEQLGGRKLRLLSRIKQIKTY